MSFPYVTAVAAKCEWNDTVHLVMMTIQVAPLVTALIIAIAWCFPGSRLSKRLFGAEAEAARGGIHQSSLSLDS
jgi:hypothetical protein